MMLSEVAKNLVPSLIPLSTQLTYSSLPILMLNYFLHMFYYLVKIIVKIVN